MKVLTVPQVDGARGHGLDHLRFREQVEALVSNLTRVVVTAEATVRYVVMCLLADGHLLLEDTPGVGKTLMAKTLARSIQAKFARVQCTPDLLPSDITGTSVFYMQEGRFEFKPGPIFSNILVADEINRTGPRTQSALLEAMAERQVTADGVDYPLPRPFMVIATQNMAESHGVFPLPDSQLDRFLVTLSMGLPNLDQEVEILDRAHGGEPQVPAVLTAEDVLWLQEQATRVRVARAVREYMARIAQATRQHPDVARGVSPRGTVLLQRAAKTWAAMEGRSFVVPEDVKAVAPLVLPHRIDLTPGAGLGRDEVVAEVLSQVAVPL